MGFAPSLIWLSIGRFFAGIFGANYAVANAYIADISPPEKRAQNFSLIGAAFGVGFILGPAIGGLLGGWPARALLCRRRAPGCSTCSTVSSCCETLAPRTAAPSSSPAPIRSAPSARCANIRWSSACSAQPCSSSSPDVNPSTWSYYAMLKFGWSEAQVGASLFRRALHGADDGPRHAADHPRIGEARAALLGLAMTSIGFMGFAFRLPSALPADDGGPLLHGAGHALAARHHVGRCAAECARQCKALSSVVGLTMIVAPVLATQTFAPSPMMPRRSISAPPSSWQISSRQCRWRSSRRCWSRAGRALAALNPSRSFRP